MTEKYSRKKIEEMRQSKVELLRNLYPVGSRVKCDRMYDSHAVPSGTEGTVHYVDDIGTIHVEWDNGSFLGLIYGEDEFTRIK